MNKIKVLQIGKYFPPIYGGIETVVKEMSEGLSETGDFEVTVVSSNIDRKFEETLQNGVRLIRIPRYGRFFSQPLCNWSYYIKNFQPDIIHFHSPNPLAMMGLNKIKTPTVVSYHADVTHHPVANVAFNFFWKSISSKVDKIIVSSKQLQSSKNLLPVNNKTLVIPFGVQTKNLNFEDSDNIKPTVLFIGRLVKYKGVQHLIESMKWVDGQLIIVGDGPEKSRLQFLVQKFHLKNKVNFLGPVNDDKKFQLIRKSSVVALPSVTRQETFGISLIEAQSQGKSVVTTQLDTGLESVNIHGLTGFNVPERNSKTLGHAINKILSTKDLRNQFSANAFMHFDKNFRRSKMIESIQRLYLDLLTEKRSASVES